MLASRSSPRLLPALLLVTLAASRADAEGGIASVGAESDDQSGYLVFGALGGRWASTTSWDLAASRSETSTALARLRTTFYDGSIDHDFGRVGLRAGLSGWRDEDIAGVGRLSARVDFHGTSWSLSLDGELRRSDFDPFIVDRTIQRRDGSIVTVSATADCAVDNSGLGGRLTFSTDGWRFSVSGLGGRLTFSTDGWRFSVSGMSYDYDDFGCDFGLQPLDSLREATRDEFVQLADGLTDVLALGSARRLLAETSFLDKRLGLSLRRETAARSYSVDYDRVEEVFFGRAADTLSAGIEFPFRTRTALEIYAGVTTSDVSADVMFVGLSVLIAR